MIGFKERLENSDIGTMEAIIGDIEDQIALWEDIAEAVEGLNDFIELSFIKNVLMPLVVGPLAKEG